jgi:serine/threonine-protein kinase
MTAANAIELEFAQRIADGEAVDLSALEKSDPDLARRLAKVQSLARAMQGTVDGGMRWGHLQQLQAAGEGGFGAVYRAYDPTLDRIVALKLRHAAAATVLPSGVDFVAEARRLARVRHPHVLAVHGASYHDGRAGLWTDWIEGETLSARIDRGGALCGDELLRVLQELAAALAAVHQAGLVHGDVKASNVMLDLHGRVVLMDFGAGFESSDEGNAVGAGTPRYLAPEVAAGKPATLAVDLYAYGVLAHLLATRRYPQRGQAIVIPGPQRLRTLIARLLDADPAARPRTDVLCRCLKQICDAPRVRVRRWLQASVVIGLAGIALATTIGLRREQVQLKRAERVSDFLATLYREQDPLTRKSQSARDPARVLGDGVRRVETQLTDDPVSQARLLRVLGEAQLNLSELAAAQTTLELASAKLADDRNPLLHAEIDALRGALARRGLHNEEAERYFDAALKQASSAAGSDSVAVGRIKSLSASTLLLLSRFKDAQAVAESAYALLSKRLGDDDPETIYALVALGGVQEQLRQDPQALATLRKAVNSIERRFGDDDARLARPLLLLAEVLRRNRDLPQARALLQRGARISRLRLGERNEQLAEILVVRARIESEADNADAAIAALDEAEKALPANDRSELAQIYASRGKIWIGLKDGKRAEPELRAALKLRRETGGLRTGIAWFSQAELGTALALQGRFDQAHALMSEAATELRKLLGPDAYQNALISVRRAGVYELQHDWPKAVDYYRTTLRIESKFYGPGHYPHFAWNLSLAQALSKTGDGQTEAADILDTLIAQWRDKPEIAEDYAQLMLLRCDLYAAKRDFAAARTLATQTLQHPGLIASAQQTTALQQHVQQF